MVVQMLFNQMPTYAFVNFLLINNHLYRFLSLYIFIFQSLYICSLEGPPHKAEPSRLEMGRMGWGGGG